MQAIEFNEQVRTTLEPILCDVGFSREGNDFVIQRDRTQLVLLRFGGSKFASLCQFTRFMLCFRHTFLRDLDEVVPAFYPKNGHAYPFKIKPSELESVSPSKWSYRFKLNPDDYDEIEYGNLGDGRPILRRMGKIIATEGIEWATIFTEDIALGLLTEHGSNAWCEKLWIDDYIAQKGKLLL